MFQFLLPLIFTIPVTTQPVPQVMRVPETRTIVRTIYKTLPTTKYDRVQQAVDNAFLLPTVTRFSKRTLTSVTQAMQMQGAAIDRFPHGRSFLSQDNTYVQKALRFSFRYPRTWVVKQSLEPLSRPYGGTAVWAVTVAPERHAGSALPLPVQPIADAPMPFVAEATSPGTISVVIEEVPDPSLQLGDISAAYLESLRRAGLDPVPVENADHIGWVPATVVRYDTVTRERIVQAWMIVADRAYLFTLRTNPQNASVDESVFFYILNTFSLSRG